MMRVVDTLLLLTCVLIFLVFVIVIEPIRWVARAFGKSAKSDRPSKRSR